MKIYHIRTFDNGEFFAATEKHAQDFCLEYVNKSEYSDLADKCYWNFVDFDSPEVTPIVEFGYMWEGYEDEPDTAEFQCLVKYREVELLG